MKREFPRSLVGQMALLFGAALLLAQLISFAFILNERREFNRAQVDVPAVTRFASVAADVTQASPEFRPLVLSDASRRGARYQLASASSVGSSVAIRGDTEARLRQSLGSTGVQVLDVRAASATAPADAGKRRGRAQLLLLSAQLADKQWLNGRFFAPAPPPLVTPELWLGTLLVYLFVLVAAIVAAGRIARPLRNLTRAAEAFRGNAPVAVEPSGPPDVRDAIAAFNAMNERVSRLLEEKDRTLGAIGHDLRTPLASLRIRAETVEPEHDREPLIRTIEEMTVTLEDILTLAQSGRSSEPLQRLDACSLARDLAADYREIGAEIGISCGGSLFIDAQPNLLRRALRNLVDNAVKYAREVQVEVRANAESVLIGVLDRGPGLPEDEIAKATGAFYRAEPSRNRATGGAGLGLAIAQAIVEGQGGTLTLANRAGGGLQVTISLPHCA
jgi:signal transduction histidine kinase